MASKVLLESFTARGHPRVQACHKTTLEFTMDNELTYRGDCIAGVGSTLAPASFKEQTKVAIRAGGTFILEVRVGDLVEEITGKGHPGLALDDEKEMVFRKSEFLSGRTVLISCDKSSADMNTDVRAMLVSESTEIQATLYLVV